MKRLLILAIMALPLTLMAQKKQFTLDDLIPGGSTYYSLQPENKYLTWWNDACIELGIDDCHFIDLEYGNQTENFLLNTLTRENINSILTAAERKPISHFYNATFPFPAKPLILITNGNQRSLVDWIVGKVIWTQDIPYDASNLDWNKQVLATAFTRNHNLFVIDASGAINQVSQDGGLELTYGESVHRDEFGITKGTFWSNDGSMLAFYRMDQSMVSQFPQVNITPYDDSQVYEHHDSIDLASRCAIVEPDPYPMAGETSHKVSIGIYDLSSKKTIYLNTGDAIDRYFTNIAWSPDNKSIYLIELNRDQNSGSLDEYDATTGEKIRTVFTETNEKYFEPTHPIQFLPWDNKKFIYQTRKDGYNHIYLYNAQNGKLIRQLTKGKFEVMDVIGFNKELKTIIFTSNEKDDLQKNVFSVDMKGSRIILGNSTGYHNPKLCPSGRFFLDTFSSPIIARHIDIVETSKGFSTNVLSAIDPWAAYDVPQIKVGTIKAADGVTDLYYRLVLPTVFDPNKKYPAVVYVYGGPHAHNIDASRNWGVRGWDIYMAQKGYVMFCLDNRGSENRGLDFEQATFRKLGVEEMKDQLKGVDFLKSLPYVDADRLGIHGWSFGGFMTTSLLTSFSEEETDNPYIFKEKCPFKVGVAGGPVIDWKFYEVMYGERYMDTPQTNPEGYKYTSLLGKAKNLFGRLMIIYGGNDPTCVPQHTLSFVRACIDAGTYPDLFTYPGDGHNMFGTDRIHLHKVITRYFEDHLK